MLATRGINDLEHLNLILFDLAQSQQYHKDKTKQSPPVKPQNNGLKLLTFEQICAVYNSQEQKLVDAKKAIRYKYKQADIFMGHQLRKSIWLLLSKAVFRIHQHTGYYEALKHSQYPEYYSKIIEADVRRTLELKSSENHKKLSNILRSLAKRNPYLGYCQGMNFVVNFLVIMQFEEEQCFWIVVELFE